MAENKDILFDFFLNYSLKPVLLLLINHIGCADFNVKIKSFDSLGRSWPCTRSEKVQLDLVPV